MKPYRIHLLLGALILSLTGLVWTIAPAFSTPHLFLQHGGVGYDPLTSDEADRSLAIALGIEPEQATALRAKTTVEIKGERQRLEILRVERFDAPKESAAATMRSGEVYFYDYTTDTLIHKVVDIATGAITTERWQGVQLPLTAREETRALELVAHDDALWQLIAARYATITGEPLLDIAQLETKVSLFVADAMPDQVNSAAQACGQHRCAQVLLFTVDRTVLELLPIVDLSQGQVVQLMDEAWPSAPGNKRS